MKPFNKFLLTTNIVVLLLLIIGSIDIAAKKRVSHSRTNNPAKAPIQFNKVASGASANPDKCLTPISYSIGVIDPQFKINKDELKEIARSAATEWKEASDIHWFKEISQGGITINLLFDGRQDDLIKSKSEKERIQNAFKTIKAEREQLTQLLDEADILASKQLSLQAEITLANTTEQLLARGQLLNQQANDWRKRAEEYNVRFGAYNHSFTAGQYHNTQSAIDIFFFQDKEDLRATLLHEFGHALGIEHLPQKEAIMYELKQTPQLLRPALTSFDLEALLKICG